MCPIFPYFIVHWNQKKQIFSWVNNVSVPRYVNKLERRRSRQGFSKHKKHLRCCHKKCSYIRLEKGGKSSWKILSWLMFMWRDFNEDLATFVFFFIQCSSFKINEFVLSKSTNECVLIRGFHFISYAYHSEMKGQLPQKQVLALSFLR